MSTLRTTIENLATEFASKILDALRSASIDELVGVAGDGGTRRARPARAATEGAAAARAPRPRGSSGRLGRRSAGDISRMVESIVELLAKSDGLRAEQIREALGVEAKELPRPLAEALSLGRVTKSGQKRATTYFAAGGGAGAAPKRRGRPAARRGKKR